MQTNVPLRVIKLGGSLLELKDLRQRFKSWLSMQIAARNLIVAGGGQAVEAIRELDAIHHLPLEFTHWLCVDLMSITATLASELLGLDEPISAAGELSEFLAGPVESAATACIRPAAYYTRSIAIQSNCPLPESWDCTSDSIAAWLASSIAADQLVLLKSIQTEFATTDALAPEAILALTDRGVVDRTFPKACRNLSDIRIINLRGVA